MAFTTRLFSSLFRFGLNAHVKNKNERKKKKKKSQNERTNRENERRKKVFLFRVDFSFFRQPKILSKLIFLYLAI